MFDRRYLLEHLASQVYRAALESQELDSWEQQMNQAQENGNEVKDDLSIQSTTNSSLINAF